MRSAREDPDPGLALGRWQRWADRLARLGWLVLLMAVAIGLLGGTVVAAVGPSRPEPSAARAPDPCPEPPCFDIGGMPGVEDLPMVLTGLCYLVAVLLGMPSVPGAVWDARRGRWARAGTRLLVFVGPVLVVAGTEVIPHVLPVCALLPRLCEGVGGGGRDVAGRWHQLQHTLLGALPLVVLYGAALRRWRPVLVRLP